MKELDMRVMPYTLCMQAALDDGRVIDKKRPKNARQEFGRFNINERAINSVYIIGYFLLIIQPKIRTDF